MSFSVFNKDNLDIVFKELAKEYKKLGGKAMPAEIILVGGAAIVANYNFRESTDDVDAYIFASSIMKDAIRNVSNNMKLPVDWLNDDFVYTESFSHKIVAYSKPYKIFNNVLRIRIISAEYLIAMKLKSARKYKKDLSDIIGILTEQRKIGMPLNKELIYKAYNDLYDNEKIDNDLDVFINNAINSNDINNIYNNIRRNEEETYSALIQYNLEYPNEIKESNVNEIIESIKNKQKPQ